MPPQLVYCLQIQLSSKGQLPCTLRQLHHHHSHYKYNIELDDNQNLQWSER
jgi:hypothetical protein